MLSLRCATRIDGICYYIWTDIFFGDMSNGRMNQFVPQLILGNALDGSSGAPAYKPKWGEHKSYSFGNTARTLQHHACMCHGLAHAGFPPHPRLLSVQSDKLQLTHCGFCCENSIGLHWH